MVPAINASATNDGYMVPAVAAATTHTQASLTVVSAEGDRVTLSSSLNVETAVVGYDARGHVGSPEGAAASRSVESSVSIEVQGDLSAAEKQDLRAVARAFQNAVKSGSATDFYDRLDSGDLDSLASVSGESLTTTASVFSARSSEPSALPVRPSSAQIGTPPLARAIDLLRSMILALRPGRDDEPIAEPPKQAPPASSAGGSVAPLASNIAQA